MITMPVFAGAPVLRVCADPDNLPFSNRAGEGFENRLAVMLANDLGVTLENVWWAQRKNFVENSLMAGKCDVLMGVPATPDSVAVTKPYYESTYVFLARDDRKKPISSLFDPGLESMRIGIHVVDSDYAPPAGILARRGLSANLVGFSLYGSEAEHNPPARLVEAVRRGDVDIAIVWGPLAGYFSRNTNLRITPVSPPSFLSVPFVYAISMATRNSETALLEKLNDFVEDKCTAIQALLNEYGVPLISGGQPQCVSTPPASVSSR